MAGASSEVRFSQAEADHVVEIPKSASGEVIWERINGSERASVRVANTQGQHLELRLRVHPKTPEQLHVMLIWGQTSIRRLDVRDDHVNDASDEVWRRETHKHRWTDRYGDGEAYTPDDIPEPESGPVTPDHYREIVEAFCREYHIDPGELGWSDPDMREESS